MVRSPRIYGPRKRAPRKVETVQDDVPASAKAPSAAQKRDEYTITRPAVIFKGGPRSGWVYYEDDALGQARHMAEIGRGFDYAPTGAEIEHPVQRNICKVWGYRPELLRVPESERR